MNIAVVKVAVTALSLVLLSSAGFAAQQGDAVKQQSAQQRVSYEAATGKTVHNTCCKPNSNSVSSTEEGMDESIDALFPTKTLKQSYKE